MPKPMHLALDLSWTQVEAQWRLPGSRVGPAGISDTREGDIADAVFHGVAWPRLDMSPWITAMSRVTQHLGSG